MLWVGVPRTQKKCCVVAWDKYMYNYFPVRYMKVTFHAHLSNGQQAGQQAGQEPRLFHLTKL